MPDLVALAVPAGQLFVDLIVETWDQGMAFAPLDPRLPAPRQEELLGVLAPTQVVRVGPGDVVHRSSFPGGHPVQQGDALVLATSGTGGVQKAVVHTHESIKASAEATSAALAVDPANDKWLCCLPVSHIGGLSVVLRSLITGTPLLVHDGFDAERVHAAARHEAVTLVSLVTRALNQVPPDLFRTVLIGGAAPPSGLPANVVPTYGMTETGSGVVYGRQILDGCEVALLGSDQSPVNKPELSGRIALRGPMLFRGYRSPEGAVAAPFFNDGWFDTGDLGRWSTDGILMVEGRDGDVIVTGGEKVWPTPIEQLLTSRTDIAEVALIGRADADWGHRVVAVVVASDPEVVPTLAELREAVVEQFPSWCAPKEMIVRAAPLPRTSLGKLQRNGLLET